MIEDLDADIRNLLSESNRALTETGHQCFLKDANENELIVGEDLPKLSWWGSLWAPHNGLVYFKGRGWKGTSVSTYSSARGILVIGPDKEIAEVLDKHFRNHPRKVEITFRPL